MEEGRFLEFFTADKPVVFAFHGYQRAIHAIIHGRTNTERFHVRGFMEEGTTTTPFESCPQPDEPFSPVHRGVAAIGLL
jgi:xylulose-5-phosphate/fructose-6-phosphate phosphoketolase